MQKQDAAYIAGWIDAKGVIKIEPPKSGLESILSIWITDSNFKLMEYLQKFGAKVIQLEPTLFRAKWINQNANRLLKEILPSSIKKREHLIVGIEFSEEKAKTPKDQKFDITYRLRLKLLKKAEA